MCHNLEVIVYVESRCSIWMFQVLYFLHFYFCSYAGSSDGIPSTCKLLLVAPAVPVPSSALIKSDHPRFALRSYKSVPVTCLSILSRSLYPDSIDLVSSYSISALVPCPRTWLNLSPCYIFLIFTSIPPSFSIVIV